MKKYINFTLILFILTVFDIITTQYALTTYPQMREGNPIMALVTSSFLLFCLVKAFGVMFIVGLYHRIKKQSVFAAKIGQTAIIMLMLFVVGNNLIMIGGATTTYGLHTPNSLEYPGRVELDGSLSYAFIIANGSQIQEWGTSASVPPYSDGDITNSVSARMVGGTFVYAVQDWAHPYRYFGVASNKDVFYSDTLTQINWSNGYFDSGYGGCSLGGNCNDIHKIGVLTTLNTKMNGVVDINGDFLISEGNSIVKFVKASDYTKTTLFTAQDGGNDVPQISSMAIDSIGDIHILVGGYFSGTTTLYYSHQVYHNNINILTQALVTRSGSNFETKIQSLLIDSNQTNTTHNIVFGYLLGTSVYLKHQNSTGIYDICPTVCSTITGFNGLQSFEGYAYIASSAENKIYRFPNTIQVLSGSGYTLGSAAESTDLPDLTYTTKSINSMYANYYNTSKFTIQSNILFDSGYYVLGDNYGINSQNYRWEYRLVDPNGVTVNSWDTGACADNYITCKLNTVQEYSPPSSGWQAGSWYIKLYEHKIASDIRVDSAEQGNLALLTTSATWNVYNGSVNATGNVGIPTEPITSPDNQAAVNIIDSYVSILGLGINTVSKFLFALLIASFAFVVGMWMSKSGMIGLALSSIPYVFFAYIGYIPKWVFVIYVILLVVISKVFR